MSKNLDIKNGEYYYTLNNYLKDRYGEKVYKLALEGGMTCPNRDGKIGKGGCIFCSGGGSGEFAVPVQEEGGVTAQIEAAKKRIQNKTNARKFIAYFQSYTNTYAPVEYLRRIFYEAVDNEEVVILSVATRPDCLSEEVIELLEGINKIKPVWIELGLQTIKEETAEYIRRGYKLSCYNDAVKKLHKAGIDVITHVILGLPGESKEDMLNTVKYITQKTGDEKFPYMTQGIKLQLLHVLKGTDLYNDYKLGKFKTLEKDEYIDILLDCISVIPKDVVVHRITGDGPRNLLESPKWSLDKKNVLNTIRKELKYRFDK